MKSIRKDQFENLQLLITNIDTQKTEGLSAVGSDELKTYLDEYIKMMDVPQRADHLFYLKCFLHQLKNESLERPLDNDPKKMDDPLLKIVLMNKQKNLYKPLYEIFDKSFSKDDQGNWIYNNNEPMAKNNILEKQEIKNEYQDMENQFKNFFQWVQDQKKQAIPHQDQIISFFSSGLIFMIAKGANLGAEPTTMEISKNIMMENVGLHLLSPNIDQTIINGTLAGKKNIFDNISGENGIHYNHSLPASTNHKNLNYLTRINFGLKKLKENPQYISLPNQVKIKALTNLKEGKINDILLDTNINEKNKEKIINSLHAQFDSAIDEIKHIEAKDQTALAEEKMAAAIKAIHAECLKRIKEKREHCDYDAQGIATIQLEQAELTAIISAQPGFENKSVADLLPPPKKGIVVQLYNDEAKDKHSDLPPFRYMIEQKIESIFTAAATLHPLIGASYFATKKAELIKKIKQEFNVENKIGINQYILKDILKDDFQKHAEMLMADYTAQALADTYSIYKAHQNILPGKKEKLDNFTKKVMRQSIIEDANHSILTFADDRFSYDHRITKTTSHNRKLRQKAANVSLVVEGKIANQPNEKYKINSTIFKNASLPPISNVKFFNLADKKIDVLISTCNHIEEMAQAMADYRRHGGAKGIVEVDWIYQLLTSNAGNKDKQALTYGQIINAMNVMSNARLNKEIDLTMHVFNAGINTLGNVRLGKTATQRKENRKAWVHLNQVHQKSLSLLANEFNETRALSNHYFALNEKILPLQGKYHALLIKQRDISSHFDVLRKEYNDLQDQYKDLKEETDPTRLRNLERPNRILDVHNALIKKRQEIAKVLAQSKKNNRKMHHITYRINKHQKAHWKKNAIKLKEHLSKHAELLKKLEDQFNKAAHPEEKDRLAKKIIRLSMIFIKHQMDNLYYSGEYRQPEKAALFNAYLGLYQRLNGLMASTGCKSANDRTYVVRLLIAAISGEKFSHLTQDVPPDLLNNLSIIAMSNSAGLSAIVDTKGGTPKVNSEKFPVLGEFFPKISEYGDFAAHKMKGHLDKLVKQVNKKLPEIDQLIEKSTEAIQQPVKEKTPLEILKEGYQRNKNTNEALSTLLTQLKYQFEYDPKAFQAKIPHSFMLDLISQKTITMKGYTYDERRKMNVSGIVKVDKSLFDKAIAYAADQNAANLSSVEKANCVELLNALVPYLMKIEAEVEKVKETGKEKTTTAEETLEKEFEDFMKSDDDADYMINEHDVELKFNEEILLEEHEPNKPSRKSSTFDLLRTFSHAKEKNNSLAASEKILGSEPKPSEEQREEKTSSLLNKPQALSGKKEHPEDPDDEGDARTKKPS